MITRCTLLYTEMIAAPALVRGNSARALAHHPSEHPLALQVGGAEPRAMAECARLAERHGFDEVNINVGCPSSRVRSGRFGACLMREPELVARCVEAMRAAAPVPVTVKTRVGVDELDTYSDLARFVETVAGAGCNTVVVHARKAWLQGLSPKENRTVPPLRYDRVRRLKRDFPELEIIVNGGVSSVQGAIEHLTRVDGVMIGRAAYRDPYLLAQADAQVFGLARPVPGRAGVVERLLPYVEQQRASGERLGRITRHLLGLFQGRPGARRWRRHLSEHGHDPGAGPEVIRDALALVVDPT